MYNFQQRWEEKTSSIIIEDFFKRSVNIISKQCNEVSPSAAVDSSLFGAFVVLNVTHQKKKSKTDFKLDKKNKTKLFLMVLKQCRSWSNLPF